MSDSGIEFVRRCMRAALDIVFPRTCVLCGSGFDGAEPHLCPSCHQRLRYVMAQPACPRCGGVILAKGVSRFARLRSEDETMESLTDESAYGDIENDPRAMRRWVRDISSAMDEEMEEDFESALEDEMKDGGSSAPDDTVY